MAPKSKAARKKMITKRMAKNGRAMLIRMKEREALWTSLRQQISETGEFIEDLVQIRTLLGDTPDLTALISSEAALLRDLINALLTARGIAITPVITVSDADIVAPTAAPAETVG